MKKYIIPSVKIIDLSAQTILASSSGSGGSTGFGGGDSGGMDSKQTIIINLQF